MEETVVALIGTLAFVVGGVLIILMAMFQRSKSMELRHRERMAMIDKGLIPPPERDPSAFDGPGPRAAGPNRATSLGIAVVAIGVGLMLLIGVAGGAPGAAIGVGGAIVVVGIAFIVNGRLYAHAQPTATPVPPPAAREDTPHARSTSQ